MYFQKGLVLKNTIISKLIVPKVHNNVQNLIFIILYLFFYLHKRMITEITIYVVF